MTMTRLLHSIKGAVRRTPLFPLLRPRAFHAFGVGAPKTGTVSLAAMFAHYAAEHEPLGADTIEIIRSAHNGDALEQTARRLKQRDRELYLELESSHWLGLVLEELVLAFPRARFILTVREPRAWLDSVLNQHLNVPHQRTPQTKLSDWDRFYFEVRDWYHGDPNRRFAKEEESLKEAGLYPLDGYLGYWAAHNRRVTTTVPRDRLLIVRTSELATSLTTMADFLGIPADTLERGAAHAHRAPRRHGKLDELDPAYVNEKITQHCKKLWKELQERSSEAQRGQASLGRVQ